MDEPAPLSSPDLPRPRRVQPVQTPEGRFRSGMLRRFGLLYWLSGLWLLLRRQRLEEHSAEHIRQAAERGPLVYALHTRSLLDWVALNAVLNTRRLPLPVFTTGVRSTFLRPVVDLVREVWGAWLARLRGGRADHPLRSGWFSKAVAAGRPSCVFLVKPRGVTDVLSTPDADAVEALIAAQALSDRPIQVVPVVVVWQRKAESARGDVARFLLGSQDEPGPLQKLFAAATGKGGGLVQAGEALDLGLLLQRYQDEPQRRQVRAARILLRRYLYRESRVVRGPRIRPYRWTRRLVLQSPEVRQLVAEEARASGRPEAAVRAEVDRTLDHIAARMSHPMVALTKQFCDFLFTRIFAGVDFRDEDAERLRNAVRQGTPVLVSSHRSHLDYLLISWLLYNNNIVIPHIVAGENLSFFPLGAIFRRMGAFFIRRSFKGDRIFPVVFERYLRQLVRDGFPVEFYIEGSRSRTGKLLPAKLGVLSMVLDAASHGRDDRTVTLLPISISYEQIAEAGTYARELSGERKRKENIGQVMRAGSVFRKRFGRVYLRVGEGIPTSDVFSEAPEGWGELGRTRRQEVLQRTGERLMFRIAQGMVLLPTSLVALALMAQSRRGIRLAELQARVRRFDAYLRAEGAQPAHSMAHGGWVVEQALRRFKAEKLVARLDDEVDDILQVVEDRRMMLEYYKNGLLHFMAPMSLMAAAVRACAPTATEALDLDELHQLFRTQVFVLRYEFTLDPEVSLEELEAGAVAHLLEYGALKRDDEGTLRVGEKRFIGELAELTRNFIESYDLVLRGAHAMRSRDLKLKELPTRIQEWGRLRLAVDELRRPEALSLVNLRNAVGAFREEGALMVRTGGGGLQFDESAYEQYTGVFRRLLS